MICANEKKLNLCEFKKLIIKLKNNTGMKKMYLGACTICTVLGMSAQEVLWQKDIKSTTQDFLSQVTTTIDQQYLITGSSIQSDKLQQGNKQNNGYDFHLVKLNQQ